MEHIAIDLGGRESQICVRRSDGTIVEERRCATTSLAAYLRRREKARVLIETSSEAFAIADMALSLEHDVRVIPATLVRALGVGARGVKNDRRDAQALSKASVQMDLESVHIPSKASREAKSLLAMRDVLVSVRTAAANSVHGALRGLSVRITSGAVESLPTRVRRHYERHKATEVPQALARQLETVEFLTTKIAEADADVETLAKSNPVCERLMTVPGVGPVTAARFVSTLDTKERFPDAHKVESYLGLTPGEDSSSDRKRMTSITKAGSSRMRWTLVQACWSARRWRPNDPMVVWSRQVEQRRGKRIAIVALARKLAGVLYAIWRDGTTYDPQHQRSLTTTATAK